MRNLIATSLLFFLAACASPTVDNSLGSLHLGMDKDAVLEKVGNPKNSQRVKGKDIWTYGYFKNEKEFRQKIVFEDGRISEIMPLRPYPDPLDAMDNSMSIDEYQKLEKDLKKDSDSGFKDVD